MAQLLYSTRTQTLSGVNVACTSSAAARVYSQITCTTTPASSPAPPFPMPVHVAVAVYQPKLLKPTQLLSELQFAAMMDTSPAAARPSGLALAMSFP